MPYPLDSSGNIRVDFVWGNVPMQPDEQRTDTNADWVGADNQSGDRGWSAPSYGATSDTLDTTQFQILSLGDKSNLNDSWDDVSTRSVTVPTIHDIATTGYSNYPAYEPNYAGDGDTNIETFVKMPDLAGLTTSAANALIGPLGFPSNVMVVNTTRNGATTVNDGKIESQSPLAGVRTKNDVNVNVQTYNAPEVPNVAGLTEAAATTALNNAGLVKGAVTTADNAGGATALNNNLIKSATPAVGTTVNTGSSVALVKYAYTAASTTGPISGFNREPGTSFSLSGNDAIMYLIGRTVRPAAGDTITVSGTSGTKWNQTWTVVAIENNDSYNTGGTAVKVTAVDDTSFATPDTTSTGGTWTKI